LLCESNHRTQPAHAIDQIRNLLSPPAAALGFTLCEQIVFAFSEQSLQNLVEVVQKQPVLGDSSVPHDQL